MDFNAFFADYESRKPKELQASKEKWYQGDAPTYNETLGRIYSMKTWDAKSQVKADMALGQLRQMRSDPSSAFYDPYAGPTSHAASELQALGIDTSTLDDNFLNSNRGLIQSNLIYNGTTNTPSKPGKNATQAQWASYWLYKYYENEGQTKKAEEEWQAAQNEAKYLAGRTDLNYSDDQIMEEVNRNFASKYPTLAKMRENQFDPIQLNRTVNYSDDALRGSIWEARNPDYTGDLEGAMAYSYLGRGNQWQYDPEIAAKLNKGDENTYAPYSVGMAGTKVNAAGLYFNMPSFNQEWLDQNRESILNGNDEQAKKHYNEVREAELTTQQAEKELAELNARVEKWVSQGLSEDRIERNIDQLLESSEFSTLRKMDNSIKTGMDEDVLNMTRSVPYRRADIIQGARDRVALRDGTDGKNETLARLQIPEMNEYGRKQKERWEKEHPESKDEVVTDTPATIAPQTPGEKLTEEAQNRNATSVISILYGTFTPSEQKHFDAQPLINGEKTAQDLYHFKTSKVGGGTQAKNYAPYNPEIFEDPTWAPRMAAQLQQEADDKYSSVAYETLETRTNYETMQAYNAELAEENRMLTEEYADLVLAHEVIPYNPSAQLGGDEGPTLYFSLKEDGTYELDMNYDWEGPAINEYLVMNNMTREDFDAEVAKQKAILDAKADRIRQAKEKTYQADPYAAAQQERFYDSLPDAKVVAAHLAQSEEYLAKNQTDYEAANKAVESVDKRRKALRKVMARSGVAFTATSDLDNELKYVSAFTNYKSPQANADGTIGELEATFGGRDLTEEEAKNFHAYIDKLQENVDDVMFMANREGTPENYKGWMGQYAEDTKKQIRMYSAYLMTKDENFAELVNTGKGEYWTMVAESEYETDTTPGTREMAKTGWSLMTELEQNVYYAMYAKEGKDAADQYYKDLEPSLIIRSKEGLARNAEARAKSGILGRVANLAIDIGLAAVEVPASLMYLAGSALHGEGDQWLRIPSEAAKQSYGQTIEELHRLYKNKAPVFDTIITGLTEMIHNRGRSAVVAGMFSPYFPAGTNEVFLAMPMATTAMADALDEAFERGATPLQAWTLATINFLAESVTEGIELKHMKRAFSAGSAGKYTIKDFLISRIPEGISETIGEVTNNIVERTADNIIMGEKSKHKAAVQAYIDQGYMPDDAENMVVMDEFKDDLHTALISFASSYLDLGAYGLGKIKTNWQYAKEVDNLRRIGDATTTIHDLRARDQKGAKALQTALEKADEAALNKPLNPFFSNEEKAQAPKLTTEEQNAQQPEYDTDITILANSSESDQTTVTATLAAVLRTDDMNAEQAMAAAESLADVLGEDTIGSLMELWEGGIVSGADINTLRLGLQYAALADGRCRAIITGQAGNAYELGTPESKVRLIAEAVQHDMANQGVQEQMNSAVHEYRVATVEHQLMAEEGPSGQLETANTRMADADNKANIASDRLEKQRNVEAAAAEAVAEAGETMANEPSDQNAKQLDRTRQDQESQAAVTQEYEQSEENAHREAQKVRAETEQIAGEVRADLRQRAEDIVAQQDQERAETAAQLAEQQRIAQEETARQQAEEDERTGKAQEERDAAAVEAIVNNEGLEGVEREQRVNELDEQQKKVKFKLRDLKKPVSDSEGMIALGALERKLGIKIQLEDLGPITKEGWTRGQYVVDKKTGNAFIRLNKNMSIGQALVEAALHEITHSMQGTGAYKSYRNIVLESVFKTKFDNAFDFYNSEEGDKSGFHAMVDQIKSERLAANDQNFVGKSLEDQVQAAEEEIIADFARANLAEKEVVQRFMDAGLGGKMRNMLHNINQALKNYFGNMSDEERKTAEYLRRAERAYQKAIDQVAKQSVHPEANQFSIMQIAQATRMTFNENTLQLFDQNGNEIDGVNRTVTPEMIQNTPVAMLINNGLSDQSPGVDENGNQIDSPRVAATKMMAGLMNMVARYKDSNLVWEIGATTLNSTFSALKSNSDPQYKTTVDFGTVCAKTQAIIDTLSQVMLDKVANGEYGGLTRKDIMKVYDAVNKAGLSVPCPVCYVFSRWMGVPSLLGQMSQYQHDFVVTDENGKIDKKATQKKVDQYIKNAEKLGDAKAINNKKTQLQNKRTAMEENRVNLEKASRAKNLTTEEKANIQKQLDNTLDQLTDLDNQIGELSAYNWITQALCKKDKNGKYVVDDKFQLTPDEVLFDLNKTGEFAKYEKNWRYRNTRGAGMGKAIMPYSGETIGDILYGVKKGGRQNSIRNPWLNMDDKAAARQLREARARAIKQNLVGGQRLQSTSDFRPEWGLDYIMSFLELQAAGSKVQMYTKVSEAVDFFASVGADVNLSIMGRGTGWHEATADEIAAMTPDQRERATIDGKVYVLDFSDVTGMKYGTAVDLKNKYDNVQMILVGMNDTHIRLAMANSDIDFIIPWHSSGNSKDVLAGLISAVGEKLDSSVDYTTTQSDMVKGTVKKYTDENGNKVEYTVPGQQTEAEKALWDARMKLLTKGGDALTLAERKVLLANPITADLYKRFTQKGVDPDCYGVKLSKEQASQIFPYEYWDTSSTKENADVNGKRFVEYCEAMGIVPRFSQFKDDTGYWKLLIDRPMYNNDGSYHQQQVIDVTNARIGDLNESGELVDSDLPTQAQAKYAPKDPRNPNYEQYTEAQKQAVENAEASIREQYDDGTTAQNSVYGFQTEADREVMRQAEEDYQAAVERGDMEAAQEAVDYAAEQAGYTTKAYHGTTRQFNAFRFTGDDLGIHLGTKGQARMMAGRGKDARVIEAYVKLENPIHFERDLGAWEGKRVAEELYNMGIITEQEAANALLSPDRTYRLSDEKATKNVRDLLISKGYDGFVYDNDFEGYSKKSQQSMAVFNPNQIKLAAPVTYDTQGNVVPLNQRFSDSADIRYSSGGIETEADRAVRFEYMKSFAEQLHDYAPKETREEIFGSDSLLVGGTPDLLKQIGLPSLPVVINQEHVGYALDGTYPVEKYRKGHIFAEEELAKLPDKIADPVAITYDSRNPQKLVIYVDMINTEGDKVIAPLQVGVSRNVGGKEINTNALLTLFEQENGSEMIASAIKKDSDDRHTLFYLNKEKALSLDLPHDIMTIVQEAPSGINHIINGHDSKVNTDIKDQTESKQFKEWFKKSKVRNEDGSPRIVYHGTSEDFTAFDMSKGRSTMDIQGAFFSPWEEESAGYGDNVGAFYLNIKNPASEQKAYEALRMFQGQNEAGKKAKDYLISQGFDGVISEVDGQPYEYIAFYPEQIKSATDNIGTFDGRNPDYRYSTGGIQTEADEAMAREAELNHTLVEGGALTAEEVQAYEERYHKRPLEARKATEGSAERAFGDVGGMLDNSDEISTFAKSIVKAQNTYFPDTNYGQINRAIDWIKSLKRAPGSDGYSEALEKVTSPNFDYRSADGQARMVAVMGLAAAKNDVLAQAALADSFNRQGTDLGRALQARKLFRMMTPEGRISILQKMLQNTTDELGAKGINADIKFSEWIYRACAVAETEADFRKVQQAAAAELASQIPANWRDKFRSWRMLSMLGNPRTHIRNVIGNAFFVPVVSMKNKLGAIMELGVEKGQRTKTLAPVLPSDVRQFARQDAIAMKDTLTGEAKFNETNMVQREQKAFKGLLQALIDFNGDALEKEDWIFLKGHYRRALGGWMQANGYTAEQLRADPALLEQGRAYAVQEAQKATYRDFNRLAATLNKVSRDGGIAGFLTDAVLPFKKTPANILRRGVEYSPVGIMKSLTADLYHLKQYKDYQNGKLSVMPEKAITPTQFIDDFCSGLAGTAVMAVGFLLGRAGIVSCGLGDDDDEFEKAKGNQKYAIKFNIGGQDFTFTMDWAAPMSMPFFVGAAVQEQFENDGEYDVEALLNAMGNITEPVFNLSMLDGVNSLLKITQNNGQDSNTTLTQIGGKILSNYATSYVPSLLGAIARTVDDTQRKAYVESGKGTGLLGTFRYAREQTENKIPGLSQTNIPVRDIWGEENTSSIAERILENFILPGYINEYRNDPIINEMARLWEATGDKGLIPDADPDKTITFNKEKHVLTAEQWDQYKENRNKTAHEMLTRLIESEDYQNATDAAQAQMIKNIWSYANQVGKNAVFPDYEVEEKGDPVTKATTEGKVSAFKTDMMTSLETGDYDGYDTMVEALHELGVEDSEIKTKIGNTYRDQYKEAYRKGDEARMAEIEDILDNTGFVFDIEKWEEQVDEKYNQ